MLHLYSLVLLRDCISPETFEVVTAGEFVATPHCVRGCRPEYANGRKAACGDFTGFPDVNLPKVARISCPCFVDTHPSFELRHVTSIRCSFSVRPTSCSASGYRRVCPARRSLREAAAHCAPYRSLFQDLAFNTSGLERPLLQSTSSGRTVGVARHKFGALQIAPYRKRASSQAGTKLR